MAMSTGRMSAHEGVPAGGHGLFITGTDTGAGKSLASATLLHALRAQGAARSA